MSEDMDNAAAVLHNVTEQYPGNRISMQTTRISQKEEGALGECETISCMGGFYLLGKTANPIFIKNPLNNDKHLAGDIDIYAGYHEGAEMFAADIGFDGVHQLCAWAKDHPDIWGNNYGDYLFNNGRAYNVPDSQHPTILNIISHLHNVAERLRDPSKRIAFCDQK